MCRKRKRVVLGLCLGWMLILMGLISVEKRLPQLFVYNATASVPVGWYLLLSPQDVARDDMVVFTVPEDVQELAVERGWLPKGTKMLKRVGGLAGDMYGVNRSRQFYVNGIYIGQASLTDGKGQQMPDRSCCIHMVEEHRFLPIGDSSHSFDGRYYGTVPLDCIKNKAVLILPTGWLSRLWR
ncbi:putative TraF peptidase [Selenomonas ruminantium subsp. lactilytica TAM6421]|uniref:Putative TraF peptidase n=1 Tax=Selenomonas ruminantium subsp. lactilytica (strain NBRC 103574 / TAM6421) TaxID=927704 RepID=I0GQF2_SELRL|nr:S26 family signal peptidase [Selenomonas ruminantium]BAL82989.1 putative TraF peptidase [Selenomonas ruminantium subsp. lactilytica TAM6421]